MVSNICYALGFASIGLSILSYGSYGIDMATYIGLWVPSFFLVGQYFERKSWCQTVDKNLQSPNNESVLLVSERSGVKNLQMQRLKQSILYTRKVRFLKNFMKGWRLENESRK